jgi:hypothetical protein
MDAQVGDVVLYEDRPHRVLDVDVTTGPLPPYLTLACDHAGTCVGPLRPVSHRHLRRVASEAS